jgi:hypothetical protein
MGVTLSPYTHYNPVVQNDYRTTLTFGLLPLVSPCEECYLGIRLWQKSVDELVTEQYLLLQELHKTANVKGGLKNR